MKPRLYLETTVPSYLVARESRDAIRHGQQAATREWWERRRSDFEPADRTPLRSGRLAMSCDLHTVRFAGILRYGTKFNFG